MSIGALRLSGRPVLQVVSSKALTGGAEGVALAEREMLEGQGVRVVTAVLDDDLYGIEALTQRLPAPIRKVIGHAADIWDPLAAGSGRRLLKKYDPGLVHVHLWQRWSLSGVLQLSRQRPTVWTLHDYALLCPRTTLVTRDGRNPCSHCRMLCGPRRSLVKQRLDRTQILFVSPSLYCKSVHEGLLGQALIEYLPNGTRSPNGAIAGRDGHGRIGYLGKVTLHKGADRLPMIGEALGHPVLVSGRGPLDSQRGIDSLGELTGEALEQQFWSRISVLVVPSRWPENAPLVVLEALQRGIPILASGVGGLPELVGEGNDSSAGIILRSWTSDGVSEAYRRLMKHWVKFRSNAFRRREQYTLERHLLGLEAVYSKAYPL